MPIYRDCPLCGVKAMHGFGPTNGGMFYYHGDKPGCRYWEDGEGNIYRRAIDMFRAAVAPFVPRTKANKYWIAAREADLTGHPRKAQRLYGLWRKEEGCI